MPVPAKSASILALLALLASCSRETSTPGPGVDQPPPFQPAGTGDVTAAVRSWEDFQAQIDSHAGRVVVVDLWALW
jgi:hypothetical protein